MLISTPILLYILLTTAAYADNAIARVHHDCVLLKSTIYCYGGATRKYFENSPSDVLHENIFISLDVSGSQTAIELQDMWKTVDGGSVGPNFYFAMAALPEINGIFIDGGRGSRVGRGSGAERHVEGNITEHIASFYNASGGGSWPSINSSARERVEAHVALTGRNNTVYIYGGRNSEEYTGSTSSAMRYPERLTTFSYLGTPQWNQPSDILSDFASQKRIHHKGAFGPDQKTIYYIGGIYQNKHTQTGVVAYSGVAMNDILSYDTSNGKWQNITVRGVTPHYRMDHTVTLDPRTGNFIIYGGIAMDTGRPLDDYLYTLSTSAWEYKRVIPVQTPEAPGAGPRFGHAAVLVDNSSLFIIFGSNGAAQSNFHVLDISDNFAWKPSVSSDQVPGDDSSDQSSGGDLSDQLPGASSPNDVTSEVNGGVIAGAVVGSIAGVSIIGALIFVYLRKRGASTTRVDNDDNDSLKPESPLEPNDAPPPYNLHQSDTRVNLDNSADTESMDVNQPLIIRVERSY